MESGLRKYCVLAHQKECMISEKRDRTQDLLKNRKSAHCILGEIAAAHSAANPGAAQRWQLTLGEDIYKVELRAPKVRCPSVSSSVCDEIYALWESCPEAISAVFSQPSDDPTESLAEFIEEQTLRKQEEKDGGQQQQQRPLAAVAVSKYRPQANVEPPEEAPREWKALLESVLDCSTAICSVNKEYKERKGALEKEQKEAEDVLVRELDELPKGTIQRVSMTTKGGGGGAEKDDERCTDTYYVRVKAPKKMPKRRIPASFFSKVLRKCIHDTLVSLDASTSVSDPQVVERLCQELRPALEEKEQRVPDARRRVSLDKMRGVRRVAAA